MLTITEIETIFQSGNRQQIEMMARNILVNGRSHQEMHQLSQHAERFSQLLAATNPADKQYLALVYILADHLTNLQHGACACTIINKPIYNSPDRLAGILDILDENFNAQEYSTWTHSRCLACRKEYESVMVESGFGQKVIWKQWLKPVGGRARHE
jgi:hypothetical protein